MSARTRVMIAGGGTAGHVLPGLAVATALVGRGMAAEELHFVGAEGKIEADLVPGSGYRITLLPGRGLQRRATLENVAAAIGLLRAFGRAVGLIRQHRPEVVLTLGGFASAACALAAVLLRVPLVVAEQNARAGAANRVVGRFARACAVPFAETDLPGAVVTGNPVRPEIVESARSRDIGSARRALGIDENRIVVVVFAGSLGSRRINEAVYAAVTELSARSDLSILHVIGTRDWEKRETPPTDGLQYQQLRYADRMDLLLCAADLAVCRSGGTTVAELAVVGVPSLLVPLPIATRDHQTANASALLRAGAAVLVPDEELDPGRLVRELQELIDGDRLSPMAESARSVGRPEAAEAVANLVVEQLGDGAVP
jgi:UDP-N-acetylglucosamine--N-acetylmuramyl-(pentapeptide) pyrophosphoryl-undecaprenol N-acetylglucosamine transferase